MQVNENRVKSPGKASALKWRGWGWVLVLVALAVPARASAFDSALIRSLFIPGLGQAHRGQYTRASIFAGAAVLSGFGLIVSQVYYNEAVDKYRAQEHLYASYAQTLEQGGVVSIEDIESTYAAMQSEHDAADSRLAWRNAFVAALVTTYAINIVDILISSPDATDGGQALMLEVGPESFRVTKAFRF